MDAGAVQNIQAGVAKPTLLVVGGRTYIARPNGAGSYAVDEDPLAQAVPAIPTLNIHTLDGFADYVKASVEGTGFDDLTDSALAVHVVNESTVDLITKLAADFPQRDVMVRAHFYSLLGIETRATQFRLGEFLDLETFVIGLQTLFVDAGDRADILRVVGNVRDEHVGTYGDDGISQEVTLKAGVVRTSTAQVPNPVTLAPFRTFREVEQPESLFVLRMRAGDKDEETAPTVALFEADGGAWRLEAIKRVRDYLRTKLPASLPVLA